MSLDDYSKEELYHYIEKQRKKLTRFESRFSALVDAYKTLNEEKQVLETTLSTLSTKPRSTKAEVKQDSQREDDCFSSGSSDPLTVLDDSIHSDIDGSERDSKDTETNENIVTQEDVIKSLEEKVAALSSALHSVTEGKAKMEAAFQADKKASMLEYKARIDEYEEDKRKLYLQEQEIKAKLRQEQNERESDENVHASMLKELQQILSVERFEKDELKAQVLEKEETISCQSTKQCLEYEERITQLTEELNVVKTTLESLEKKDKQPNNIIQDLTKEVDLIKLNHAKVLINEQKRANFAEEILKSTQRQEEERIADLETRLSQLSATVGNYDKQHQSDQEIIKKLRERLEHLESENETLSSTHLDRSSNDGKMADMQEQVTKLKNLLKITWKKADKNIDTLLSNSEIDEILKNDPVHAACQSEYKHLKEEFECYKRQQKNARKPTKNDMVSDEVTDYKMKIEKLESDLKYLESYYEEKETDNVALVTKLQIDATNLREIFEKQIEELKEDYNKKLEQIEAELRKQRNRTFDLLNDKDLEIERLQKILYDKEDSYLQLRSERSLSEKSNNTHTDGCSVVDEMLTQSPTISSNGGLFHYTQQLSHLEAELSLSRSKNIDLESDVRDAEHREQQVLVQMQALKDEIRKLERGKSRESANLEYLKNVCLQYMLTNSSSVKKQMSMAISTILRFSPDETAQLRKNQNNGWW